MQRATKEILRNDCFDRLRDELGDRLRRRDGLPGRRPWPATWPPTAWAWTPRASRRCPAATSSSTRPPRSASTHRSTPPWRSTCSAPPGWPPPSSPPAHWPRPTGARAGPLRARVDGLRGQHPPGRGQGGAPRRQPVHGRRRLAARGRGRPPSARRHRGRVPAPRTADQFHKAAREELGGAGLHLLAERAERLREDWVKKQMVADRPGPGPVARLARRLPVHEGPGRAGPGGPVRRHRADHHHPALRSSSRRWPSPDRVGSAASAWPSRSSSPTPAACSASSRACPRASPT